MIPFEEKMLDTSKIFFAEIIDNFNSKKVYYNSTLIIEFLPEMQISHIRFDYKTHEEAISKLNQLMTLINLQKNNSHNDIDDAVISFSKLNVIHLIMVLAQFPYLRYNILVRRTI